MASYVYPDGLGGSSGDSLATAGGLHITDGLGVYFVDSATGNDSNAGTDRAQPKATLASAITAASDDEFIVLLDGHAETLTAEQAIAERLTIIGEGSSGGKPTVKFTMNSATAQMFNVTGTNVEFRNIFFEEQSQANSGSLISVNAGRFAMIGCYLEADGNSDAECVLLTGSAEEFWLESCTFVSTGTSVTDVPENAVRVSGAVADCTIRDCIFDGGTYGWESGRAYDETAAVTRLRATGISLLRGASMRINASTVGYVQAGTRTGGARVEI